MVKWTFKKNEKKRNWKKIDWMNDWPKSHHNHLDDDDVDVVFVYA